MHYPVNVFVGKIRDYAGSRPARSTKSRSTENCSSAISVSMGTSRRRRKSTAGRTARCVIIRANTMPTGSVTSPAGRAVLRAGVRRKPLHHRAYRAKRLYRRYLRWGEALIQVTQPRSPCFKLNFHFAINDMAQLMQNSGKTGWLYRVIAGGQVSSDAPLELVSRLSDVSVHEAGAIAWQMPFDDDQYHRLLSAAGLSVSWSRTMQKRRLSGKIEDSSRRLWGNNPHIKYSRDAPGAAPHSAGRVGVRFVYTAAARLLNADHPAGCRRPSPSRGAAE